MKLKGRLTFEDLGAGAWVLVSEDGKRYELHGVAGDKLSEGARVEVEGELDKGSVSTAMAAPALHVKRWHSR
jgi:Protein of unknown function (DUF5818)